ncbi:MAG: eukaryotic-like serine/threonine-protein kinase [Gaiellaceae bacterium]|nr:eukaryotic-like serine/threonine-protein kinase [Gaiellaceae bacterium]
MSAQLITGRYRVERPLGHGAMSTVDLALDLQLDREVALKRLAENLARDDDLRARFQREARLAARLAHPNVVRIYDVGEDDDGRPFIAMEYVEGETLAEAVARRGPLPPREVAELGIQACRALAAAHEAGLVHRDVKPQNLLLRSDGVLKLGDFGVAVGLEGTRLTMVGTVLGTAAYLAPEQARGEEVTAAADVYGLGAVLYELLTGTPPRTPATLAELTKATVIPVPRDAPPELARVVMRCLAAEPNDRPASAAELAGELAATNPDAQTLPLPGHPSLRATEIIAPAPRARAAGASARRRPRTAVILAAAAAVAVLAGVIAALASGGGSPAKPPPAPAPKVSGIPTAPTPQQEARDLAAWLRRYSG